MTEVKRIRELLAGEAAGERLDDAEHSELRELLAAVPAADRARERDAMHQAAALGQAAFLGDDPAAWRPMPESLRGSLLGMASARALDMAGTRRRANWQARWGWAAAAAMALVWIVSSVLLPGQRPAGTGVSVHAADDLVRLPWRSRFSEYEQVRGEVVWSDALQAGEMRFVGLPPNNPDLQQYQLWVVDPDRHAPLADAGVFDIPSDGYVVIPVAAKLDVQEPAAFAVTLEQPGGVVVSEGPFLVFAATGERPAPTL